MEANDDIHLSPELVEQLQTMVRQAVSPARMLEFLMSQVDNKFLFTAYMEAACLDNECDEGTIWLVASRWWTGNQTPHGADRLLTPIFEQSRARWLLRQQEHDQP